MLEMPYKIPTRVMRAVLWWGKRHVKRGEELQKYKASRTKYSYKEAPIKVTVTKVMYM